jgi:hypothetical protein
MLLTVGAQKGKLPNCLQRLLSSARVSIRVTGYLPLDIKIISAVLGLEAIVPSPFISKAYLTMCSSLLDRCWPVAVFKRIKGSKDWKHIDELESIYNLEMTPRSLPVRFGLPSQVGRRGRDAEIA